MPNVDLVKVVLIVVVLVMAAICISAIITLWQAAGTAAQGEAWEFSQGVEAQQWTAGGFVLSLFDLMLPGFGVSGIVTVLEGLVAATVLFAALSWFIKLVGV